MEDNVPSSFNKELLTHIRVPVTSRGCELNLSRAFNVSSRLEDDGEASSCRISLLHVLTRGFVFLFPLQKAIHSIPPAESMRQGERAQGSRGETAFMMIGFMLSHTQSPTWFRTQIMHHLLM